MDPNSGQIFSEDAIRALEPRANERVHDNEARKQLARLVPVPAADLEVVEAMNIRQRKQWAKARNERKRARQGR